MGVNLLQHTPLLHDNAPTGTQQRVTYSCPLLPTQERLSIGRGRADPLRHRSPVAAMTSARCATNVSPSTLSQWPDLGGSPAHRPSGPSPEEKCLTMSPNVSLGTRIPLPRPDSRALGEWRTMAQNGPDGKTRTPENACPGVRGACLSAQFAALHCPNDGHFRSFRPLSGNPGATVGSPSSWIPRTRE